MGEAKQFARAVFEDKQPGDYTQNGLQRRC